MQLFKKYSLHILLFLIILISDETFIFGTSGINTLVIIKYMFILGFSVYMFTKFSIHSKIDKNKFFFIIFVFLSAILSASVNDSISGGLFLLLSVYISSLFFSLNIPLFKFTRVFSDVVFAVALISFIVYLGVSFNILSTQIVINSAGNTIDSFFGLLFYKTESPFLRNSSIFREPGMYMIFLNLALLFDLRNENISKKRIFIFIISLISTFSTAGYIILALVAFYYMLHNINKTAILNKIFYIITILFFIYFIIENKTFNEIVFSKLGGVEDSNSTLGRISSLTIPFQIFKDNIYFGCGISNIEQYYTQIGIELYGLIINPSGMATNSFMNMLAIWGIIPGLFLLINTIVFSFAFTKGKLEQFIVILILLMSFSNEAMYYSLILNFISFYGFNTKKNE